MEGKFVFLFSMDLPPISGSGGRSLERDYVLLPVIGGKCLLKFFNNWVFVNAS